MYTLSMNFYRLFINNKIHSRLELINQYICLQLKLYALYWLHLIFRGVLVVCLIFFVF
jgi:hypothetical protein